VTSTLKHVAIEGLRVTYEEFTSELSKSGLSVRAFADLVSMHPNSVTNNAKRGEVPAHIAIIATLVSELHLRDVPCEPIIKRLNLNKKRARGRAAPGVFGGDQQRQLELGN
tara:strand:+ start:203 stop:535 length:333 start_codon:yes stop_codon:yes gene_type:complete